MKRALTCREKECLINEQSAVNQSLLANFSQTQFSKILSDARREHNCDSPKVGLMQERLGRSTSQ